MTQVQVQLIIFLFRRSILTLAIYEIQQKLTNSDNGPYYHKNPIIIL